MASSAETMGLSIVDHGDVWKKKLCRNFKVLVDHMDVTATVDDLLSQDVLDLEEKEMIENAIPNTTHNKSRIIIKLLLHKTVEEFEIFLKSLEENGHEEIASQVKTTDIHASTLPEVTSENMLELKRKIFRSFDMIVGSTMLSKFLDDFVSNGVFQIEDIEIVSNFSSTSACNREFLKILFQKDDGFQLLFQLIKTKHSGLARKISRTSVDKSVDNEIQYYLSQKIEGPSPSYSHKIPQNFRHQAEIRLNFWKSTKYVEVQAAETVFGATNGNTIVTVTGNPGTGKSATIHHVALRLADEGFDVLPVDGVKEIKKYLDPALKQVFVLDDPIGVHSLDEDELYRWVRFDETLKNLPAANTKILCSIRKVIVNENSFKITDTILNKNIIDIEDSKNALQDEEKMKILEQHLEGKQYDITAEMKKGISDIKDHFPLMCKLFASDKKFRELGLRFFLEPFDIIKKELDGMLLKDKHGYCALILCFLENNSLSLDIFNPSSTKRKYIEDLMEYCGLSRNYPLPNFKEKLKYLETMFLQREGSNYKFVHDMINDVVAYHFGSKYPEQMIKQSSSKFICERVVVSQDHVSSENENVILLDKQYFPALVERLLNDTKQGRYLHVFSHNCWDDPVFMDSFIEMFRAKRQIFPRIFKGKFVNKQDIIKLFCGTIEKYEDDIDDELKNTAAVDTWTWYYKAMSCLRIKGTSLLHWVVTFAHKDLFELIWNDISLKQKKKVIGKVPLIHFACMGGNIDICEKLLQFETNMITKPLQEELVKTGEFLPLHHAALNNPFVIDLLIENGAKVNAKSVVRGMTPIMLAAAHGNTDAVHRLISYNADINIPDCENISALYLSYQNGHDDVCKVLIDHGADVNLCRNDGVSPLYISSQKNHSDVVQLLLDHGADVNLCRNDGTSPLYISSQKNHSGIVQLLLDHGADVNLCRNNGVSPLYISSQENHSDIVQLLLDHGADVNLCYNDGVSPLYISSQKNHSDIVQLLLDHGADVNLCNNNGTSPLYNSSGNNHSDIVQLLLDHGADVNLCNNNGTSPLYISSQKNHSDIVQLLLDHGADVNLCNNNGTSPLYNSSGNNHSGIVQLLLDYGADVNKCTVEGYSPLIIACYKHNPECTKLLLDTGICLIDHQDKFGATALICAANVNDTKSTELLIKHGCDVNIRNKNDKTALEVAKQKNSKDVVQLLIGTPSNK